MSTKPTISTTRRVDPSANPRPAVRAVGRSLATVCLIAVVLLTELAAPAGAQSGPELSGQKPGTSDGSSNATADRSGRELMWSVGPTPDAGAEARPNFQYEVEAGSTIRDSFRVRNYSDEELHLAIYASDAVLTEDGNLDLLPASERPTDLGSWVDLDADELTIPSGKFVDIPFKLAVPKMAESGDHSGGIVTSLVTRSASSGGRPVVLDRRLGSRVQVRVTGDLAPGLAVSSFEADYRGTLNPFGRGSIEVTYRITNRGNVRMAVDPVIEVRGPAGVLAQRAVLKRTSELLPGTSLEYSAVVPSIWPTIRPRVTLKLNPVETRPGDRFSPGLAVAASDVVLAVPWTLLICASAAIAVPLLWLRRRRAARSDVDEKVRAAVEAALAGLNPTAPTVPTTNPDAAAPLSSGIDNQQVDQ